MSNQRVPLVLKHVVYTLVILLLYVIQTTPGLFELRGISPIWVIPAAVAISMFEGEFVGGIYGVLAGLCCDTGGFSYFGYNAIIIGFFCVVAGLVTIYLFRNNLLGCMIFVLVTLLVRGSLEFLFAYGMWGYDNVWKIYMFTVLPTAVATLIVAPFIFVIIRKLHSSFGVLLKSY